MQKSYQTPRLLLVELSEDHSAFIRELVNTEGWLRFIGERNIHDDAAAKAYIRKIQDNPAVTYWVVKHLEDETPIGVVTLIRREYLDHHDIGFAFLPAWSGQGYAFEAARQVLNDIRKETAHRIVLATTLRDNVSSIRLLQKLGFRFEREIEVEQEKLQLYLLAQE